MTHINRDRGGLKEQLTIKRVSDTRYGILSRRSLLVGQSIPTYKCGIDMFRTAISRLDSGFKLQTTPTDS